MLPPCLDLWFDARKEDSQVVVGAFCHGIAVRLELPGIFPIPHAEAYAVPIGLLMSSLPNLDLVSVQLHSVTLATALNLASGAPKTPIMLQALAESDPRCNGCVVVCLSRSAMAQPTLLVTRQVGLGKTKLACSTFSASSAFARP